MLAGESTWEIATKPDFAGYVEEMSKFFGVEKWDVIWLIIGVVFLTGSLVVFFSGTGSFYRTLAIISGTISGLITFGSIGVLHRHFCKNLENCPLVIGTIIQVSTSHSPAASVQFRTIDGQLMTVNIRDWLLGIEKIESHIQPCKPIPLRYNPANPKQVALAFDEETETLQRALNMHWATGGLLTQKEIDISEHGVKAKGVILSAQPTGNIINNCGEMALQVEVTRPGNGRTYHVSKNMAVSQNMLPLIQPGNMVEVFYMPENENVIVIKAVGFRVQV